MRRIVLLDTSVLLNLLAIPGKNQQEAEVTDEFCQLSATGTEFLLPFAAIVETGNHIAKVPDGNLRRRLGSELVEVVRQTVTGDAPWGPIGLPNVSELPAWLADFPGHVQRSKSVHKKSEGGSLGDWLIFQDWQRICQLNPRADVRIWSLDADLQAHHQPGTQL